MIASPSGRNVAMSLAECTKVDFIAAQRLFDLLGEQALAAGLRKWPILNAVAGGADDVDRNRLRIQAAGPREAGADLLGLRERKRRAARADTHQGQRRL